MDRKDFFFKQRVTQAEVDAALAYVEQGLWNLEVDAATYGVIAGLVPSLGTAPNVAVTKGIAYDQLGRRIKAFSDGAGSKTESYATATDGTVTSVTGGNERWISIYANFGRQALDPRTDGNGATVYFDQPENLHDGTVGVLSTAGLGGAGLDKFLIVAGAAAATGTAVKPALLTTAILLCDIKRTPSDASNVLDTSRRQLLNVADTAAPGAGLAILMSAFSTWLGGRTNPAQATLHAQIDKIFTDLAATASSDDGAERVGAQASGNLPSGSVRSQLDHLDGAKPELGTSNHFTGAGNTQTLDGGLSVGGNAGVTGNETVGGTLGVTGAATFTGQIIPTVQADAVTPSIVVSGTTPNDDYRQLLSLPINLSKFRVYMAKRNTGLTSSDGNPIFGSGNEAVLLTMNAKWTGSVWQTDGLVGTNSFALIFPLFGSGESFQTGSGLVLAFRNPDPDSGNITWANTWGVTGGWTKVLRFGVKNERSGNLGGYRAGTSTIQFDSGIWRGVPGDNTTSLPAGDIGKVYYLGSRGYSSAGARIAGRETLTPGYVATPTATVLTAESNSNAGSITIDTLDVNQIKWSFSVTALGDAQSYSTLEIV